MTIKLFYLIQAHYFSAQTLCYQRINDIDGVSIYVTKSLNINILHPK